MTTLKRDAIGDVVQTTDPEGRISRAVYDARRRLTQATNPAGEATAHEYDLNNHKTATVRPSGARTTYVYDSRDFLTEVREPLGRTTAYQRDAHGNLTRLTDPAGRATVYDHDPLDRRTSVTYPGGATESFAYDAAGNLTQHIDANGIAITRSYDALHRETLKTYSASADGLQRIATTYDPHGNKLSVTETYAAGTRTSTYTYDAFDRQLTAQDAFGAQIAYAYDPNGNRQSLATQDARITRYGYDGLNRLTGVASPAGSVQYLYDKSGLVTQEIGSNGTTTATAYDAAQRPTRITLTRGAAVLNLTEYAYDPNGNRTLERINRPGGAQLTRYRYDAADRLSGTTRTEGAATTDTTDTAWTYDLADNRLTESVTSGGTTTTRTYTYDARHRLTRIDDSAAGATTLSYDAQGNLLQKQQGADTTAYVWSARDLLAKFGTTGSMDPDQLLKIAQDQLVRGEFARALQLSRAAMTLAQGTANKDDIGAAAYDLIGIAYLRQGRTLAVPEHLRDSHYAGAAQLGRGEGYKYSHDYAGGHVEQEYLPETRRYYEPTNRGYEAEIRRRLEELRGLQRDEKDERDAKDG